MRIPCLNKVLIIIITFENDCRSVLRLGRGKCLFFALTNKAQAKPGACAPTQNILARVKYIVSRYYCILECIINFILPKMRRIKNDKIYESIFKRTIVLKRCPI